MKKLILLLAIATPAFAQVTPTTPAGTTTGTGGTGTGIGVGGGTAKAKAYGANEKKFVKDSLDGMFFVLSLTGQAKTGAKLEASKTEADALKGDLDKIWADVAGAAGANNEKIPTELTGGDKLKAASLGKAGDKFDKEFLKLANHEMDKLAKTFEAASKNQTDPTLKKIATDWEPTLKSHVTKLTEAEKEAAKSK